VAIKRLFSEPADLVARTTEINRLFSVLPLSAQERWHLVVATFYDAPPDAQRRQLTKDEAIKRASLINKRGHLGLEILPSHAIEDGEMYRRPPFLDLAEFIDETRYLRLVAPAAPNTSTIDHDLAKAVLLEMIDSLPSAGATLMVAGWQIDGPPLQIDAGGGRIIAPVIPKKEFRRWYHLDGIFLNDSVIGRIEVMFDEMLGHHSWVTSAAKQSGAEPG
jgi:hypothetical protein